MTETDLPGVADVTVIDNATGDHLRRATLEHAKNRNGELVLRINTAIR
jgi:hypothetical protein